MDHFARFPNERVSMNETGCNTENNKQGNGQESISCGRANIW